MKVEGITLVITDPCYIKKSPGVTKYLDRSTIYGDWSCMCYKGDKEEAKKKAFIEANCYGEFCADSGQVAVFDYATLSETDKEWIKEHDWCACIVPDYTGEFEYVIEGVGDNRSAHIVGDGFYTTQSGF